MKYVLGIDFGGGASKATLLSETGEIAAVSTVEYPTLYPQSGWTEQDPADWYEATRKNISNLLTQSGVDAHEIVAVCPDAATHTAVLLDEKDEVVCPSIYWTDIRSQAEVAYLREHYGDLIRREVLHSPDTIWTLPQLMWIKSNRPDQWSRVHKILFAKDYVRQRLTGDFVTDNIEAEGSMLFDYNRQCWSETLCGLLELTPEMLPKIVRPSDIVGSVTKEAALETGLVEGTPVLCGSTDTVMEVFAAGGVGEGDMTLKLATAGRICVVTDKAYPDRDLINYSHLIDGLWYPGTATKSCAASYRWYRDTFGGGYGELDAGAEAIAPGADGLIFSPYLNGELTPYADPKLCASFVGVRAGHTKAHFTRAVLEGVAMSMKDCLNALERIGIPRGERAPVIGGGSKSPLWRQITADVLGLTLVEKQHSDSSLGSAMLAGIVSGFWKDHKTAASTCNRAVSVTEPNPETHTRYEKVFRKYKKVHDALAEVYHDETL